MWRSLAAHCEPARGPATAAAVRRPGVIIRGCSCGVPALRCRPTVDRCAGLLSAVCSATAVQPDEGVWQSRLVGFQTTQRTARCIVPDLPRPAAAVGGLAALCAAYGTACCRHGRWLGGWHRLVLWTPLHGGSILWHALWAY